MRMAESPQLDGIAPPARMLGEISHEPSVEGALLMSWISGSWVHCWTEVGKDDDFRFRLRSANRPDFLVKPFHVLFMLFVMMSNVPVHQVLKSITRWCNSLASSGYL